MTTHISTTTRTRRLGVPSALAPALLLALGCGGGDTGSGSNSDSADSADPAAQPEAATPAPAPAFAIDPTQLPEGVTEAMVLEGREIFNGAGICYTCHTMEATGGPLAPDLTDDQWLNVDGEYASIVELVKTGVAQPVEHPGAMLPRAGMPLTDEQVAAVAAYAYMLAR